jgi:hypothetical protein
MRRRTLMLLSLLATVGVVVGALAVGSPRDHAVRQLAEAGAGPAMAPRPAARALTLLRAWDRRRAAAWAEDDPSALRALYLPGSSTGRRDVAMLAAYHRRGLQVTTMRRQVLAVQVRDSDPRTLSLVVTDRLVEAWVTGRGVRAVLPRSRPATRRIVLRHERVGWRVDEVYDD